MSTAEDRSREKLFEEAWRRRANRSPSQSPRQAAQRVTAAIQTRRRSSRVWLPVAVSASLLALVAIATLWVTDPVRPPASSRAPAAGDEAPLGPGEVLMWLDETTPLYMTFQAPDEPRNNGGKL